MHLWGFDIRRGYIPAAMGQDQRSVTSRAYTRFLCAASFHKMSPGGFFHLFLKRDNSKPGILLDFFKKFTLHGHDVNSPFTEE